jgi:outer membrane protein insertion porin family
LPERKSPGFFALLEPDGQSRLTSVLRVVYAREGFLRPVIGAPRQGLDAASHRLRVTVSVQEGERASVVALELPARTQPPATDTPPRLSLKAGEPFRLEDYVNDRGRLASWYHQEGYLAARVVGILEPNPEGITVRFEVDPGPRPTIREVRLDHEGRTRPGVVTGTVTLRPGDYVRSDALNESRERLAETQVFRSVDLRPEPADGGDERDLVVGLVDRPDFDVEYSVRYTTEGTGEVGGAPSSAAGPSWQFGGAIEAVNPFGMAHRYRIYGRVGGDRRLVGGSFDAASFFGRRWRTQLFVFDDESLHPDIPQLDKRIRGITFQQTQRWRSALDGRRRHDRLRLLWGYTFKRVDYTDLETLASFEGDRAGPILSLIGDTRDSITDPRKGLFWSASSELAVRALGSEENYAKLYGQLFGYVPLGGRVVWAQGYRLGVVPGNNPLLLLDGRFRAGGSTSVRDFPESGLGPQTPDGVALGGQAIAVFNQELRFRIWKLLHGGVFYDAGNVFALSRQLALGDLRQSAGGGLRLMFPFGPVRLDWARVLDPREGEARSRWVFGIGHAF